MLEEREEYIMYIQNLYNEWIEKEENRNISYGELAYIQDLNDKDLKDMEQELLQELEGEEF